ncbi:MAG: MFS transporter [Parasporobacterium sp.]|nr:MFS transporter [Parasporobacterium sp.]
MKKQLNRWIYAVVGVIALIFAGLIYAWSVLSSPLSTVHNGPWADSSLTWTSTIVMMFFCLGGFFGGMLQKKLKVRYEMWIAAVLLLVGFALASVSKSIIMMYLGFGLLAGLGAGFAYNAVMSSVSKWFPDKQGLISGIQLMGFGIGSFIIGKIYTAIVDADNTGEGTSWTTCFLILGIICFVVIGAAGFFTAKPDAGYKVPGMEKPGKAKSAPYEEVTTPQMLKRSSFWFMFIWAILVSVAGLAVIFLGRPIAVSAVPNLDPSSVATVVGLISIFNGIGRIIFGALFDKIGYKLTLVIDCIVFIIAMIIILLALSSHSVVILYISYIVTGLAYGGVTPSQSAFVNKFYGSENYPTNFSIMVMNLLIASFGTKLADAVQTATGSYTVVIYGVIGLCVLAGICALLIRKPNTAQAKAQK